MRAVFDDHVPAALLADLVCYLVLNCNLLQFLLRLFDGLIQIRIEVLDDRFPADLSFGNAVQKAFEIRGKCRINNLRELGFHDVIDGFAHLRHIQIFLLARDVMPCKDRCNRRRVS